MQSLFVVFLLIGYCYCQSGWGNCQRVTPTLSFDVSKYLGKWYDLYHLPFYEEENSDCITAEYSLKSDGHVEVFNSERVGGINGTFTSATGDAYAPDPTQPAKLAVAFGGVDVYRAPYWVVSTDYNSYSLVFSCVSVAGLYHFEYAWILSRTPSLPDTTIQALIKIWASVEVDTSKFVKTQQEGCW
eukprot:TRINITY_DN942_c0_g3_i1.p1 TRINITY_DN942_c0_g3~~TRINITY_DN942_c0_g3_i1.p1  ORF type:complete len:186 (+),score=33.99 TRINITY_DN942_c0_g3_i1:61-618(+)